MQSFIMAPSSTVYSRLGEHLKPTTFDYRYVTACLWWGPLPLPVRIGFEGHSNGGRGKTLNRFHVCVHLWVCLWVCLTLGKQWSPCFNWVWPSKSGGLNVTPASVPSGTHWNYSRAGGDIMEHLMQVHTHSKECVCENRQGQSRQLDTNSSGFVQTCWTGARKSSSETETQNELTIAPHWPALSFWIELSCFRSKQRACTWSATSLIPIKVPQTD